MADFMTKNFYKQRKDFEVSSSIRDKRLPFPEDVIEITNIPYANDNIDAHRLDIFRPKNHETQVLPVIINIHGGGLIIGSKEFNRFFCARLSQLGFIVYSIEYRLIPDCTFFDQLTDTFTAMDYIKGRIKDDNGDISHVYGVADSGGACLLTYATAMTNNHNLAKAAQVTPSSLKFNALGLISGMFYTTHFDEIGLFLPKYLYGKDYKKSAFAPFTNPEHPEIVNSLPPCFLVTSHNDNLKSYTINFTKALKKHDVTHKLVNFPKKKTLTHAFSVFEPFLPESTETLKLMVHFLKKY